MIRVLIVDDSALARRLLAEILGAEGDVETRAAADGARALEALHDWRPHVVTLDLHMPGMDGLACLDRIMIERPTPVVMVSAATARGADATLEALRLGAVDFIAKPAGALSLSVETMAQALVAKVRAAAGSHPRASRRLAERVRHQLGHAAAPPRPTPSAPPARAGEDPSLVLVGASTGGPPALEALLTPLPAGFPWPILVAQHMPVAFTASLARRLDSICALSVQEVTRPTPLQAGHVYIGRGDADLIVARRPGGLIALAAPSLPDHPWRPSVERLVRSALEHLAADRLIGVLMTGMGWDGAPAMSLLRARGGRTIAEAEETAVVWGMPGELVKAGGAQWIDPAPRIAGRLLQLAA